MTDPIETIKALSCRFHGFSLDYRSHGTDWPAPWRARVFATKNERSDYRLVRYAGTPELAIEELLEDIELFDVLASV